MNEAGMAIGHTFSHDNGGMTMTREALSLNVHLSALLVLQGGVKRVPKQRIQNERYDTKDTSDKIRYIHVPHRYPSPRQQKGRHSPRSKS
jgi:hypothetical protein